LRLCLKTRPPNSHSITIWPDLVPAVRPYNDDSGVWDRMKDEWTPTSNFSANSSATSHGLARGPSQQ
jgi:hypothetical protein